MISARERALEMSDGYSVAIKSWLPEAKARGSIVVLHGIQSHAGWYDGLGRFLASQGIEVHFPDRRGAGKNTEARGHTKSSRRLLDDVAETLRALRKDRDQLPVGLAGISWGGKLAVVTAAYEPSLVQGLILICPGLAPRVGFRFVEKLRILSSYLTKPTMQFPIPLADPALFTASPAAQSWIEADPLSLRTASAALLMSSAGLDRRVRRSLKHVDVPTLLMLAEHDRIVDNSRVKQLTRLIRSRFTSIIEYEGAHHTLEFEEDPCRYARDLLEWYSTSLTN